MGRVRACARSSRSSRSRSGRPSRCRVLITPVWWKSAMTRDARPPRRCWQAPGALATPQTDAVAELLEEPQRLGIDLEEREPDVGGERIDLCRPRDQPHRHDRVLAEVEGHPDGVAEVELAAHRLEADPAGRQVLARRRADPASRAARTRSPGPSRCAGIFGGPPRRDPPRAAAPPRGAHRPGMAGA